MTTTLVTQKNALGFWLPVSRPPSNLVVGPGRSVTIDATDQDDVIFSYGDSIINGGLGDDTYYIFDPFDVVVEAPAAGIDTVINYSGFFVLPANAENLIVASDGSYGIGNALANIVFGSDGDQILDGGAGDDVLIGGAGADKFLFGRGRGSDVIADFQTGVDQVVLNNTLMQIPDFTAIRAAMVQSGPDVVLNLGGDSITFRNHAIADFSSADFKLPVNVGALRLSFNENFDNFTSSPTGIALATRKPVWQTAYEFWPGYLTRTLGPDNPEAEYYSDASIGVNPITIGSGTLKITAKPAAPGSVPEGLTYTSGVITTHTSFSQLYGYFEIRATLPSGQGFWPAFWLVRADHLWPPELDVMEVSSRDPNLLLTSALSATGGTVSAADQAHYVPDMSAGFHTYGVSWRPDMLRFYFDGREIMATPTSSDMNSPMYMIASLAVGSAADWPGPPDGVSSGTMTIDYIRAYQYTDIAPTVPTASSMTVLVGDALPNTLNGGAGNDRIEGGSGDDRLYGGPGADTFVFGSQAGNDVITDFQPGLDKLVIEGYSAAQITTSLLASGAQLNFGTNHILLKNIYVLGPDDIVAGASRTSGTSGADTVNRSATTAPATINGMAGNDVLKGGAGDDWISGGPGADLLTGNGGRDAFYLPPGSGQDQITDFVPGFDMLVLTGATQDSLHASWDTVAGVDGIRLTYGTMGDSVFLSGVSSLTADSLFL
jgi:Ca2+-binding RTX toxin-like protein